MDTAHALITHFPSKQASLSIGKGTMFTCRDRLFPSGLKRWWGGSTPLNTFLDVELIRYQKRNPDHLRGSLDVLRERFDIRCGPRQHALHQATQCKP